MMGWRGVGGWVLGAALASGAMGCGEEPPKAPPPTTVPTPPPAPVPTKPAEPVAAPAKPRVLPTVEVKQGGDLVAFSNWRWKDASQQQVVGDALAKGDVRLIWYSFYDGDQLLTSGQIPGATLTTQGGPIELPAVTGGVLRIANIQKATRVTLSVVPLEKNAVPANQPAWVSTRAKSCEQGVAADCKFLAAAYRNGTSPDGNVDANAELAKRYGEQFVATAARACAMNAPDTCYLLAVAYLSGEDAPTKPDLGIAMMQKACGAGVQEACTWQVDHPMSATAEPAKAP